MHSPHLSKADELAAEEAEEILEHVEGSARSRRHERLSRLREQASIDVGEGTEGGDQVEDEQADLGRSVTPGSEIVAKQSPAKVKGQRQDAKAQESVALATAPVVSVQSMYHTDIKTDRGQVPESGTVHQESEDDDAESSTVSSTSDSDSDGSTSDSSAESDSDVSDSDDDDDDEDEQLEKLLQAARIAAIKSTASGITKGADEFAGGDEVVSFSLEEGEQRRRKEAYVLFPTSRRLCISD